jgi:hypothetical protein
VTAFVIDFPNKYLGIKFVIFFNTDTRRRSTKFGVMIGVWHAVTY